MPPDYSMILRLRALTKSRNAVTIVSGFVVGSVRPTFRYLCEWNKFNINVVLPQNNQVTKDPLFLDELHAINHSSEA